jgi:hypothetical protein
MIIIQHRVNTIKDLENVPSNHGIEVDIRIEKNKLILNHDPFEDGEDFLKFLDYYNHELIILNMKCDGGENLIIKEFKNRKIKNFFFLDCSIPKINSMTKLGIRNFAVRYSILEPLDFTLKFNNQVDWVWIDCFNGFHLPISDYSQLKKKFDKSHIKKFKKLSKEFEIDAICTKFPHLWI